MVLSLSAVQAAEDSNRANAERMRGQARRTRAAASEAPGGNRQDAGDRKANPLGYGTYPSRMHAVYRTGEMREWLNRAASKAVELLVSSEGSNPSLSDKRGEFERVIDNTSGNPELHFGEVSERPKEYAWKAYEP